MAQNDSELRTIAGLKCPSCKLSTLFLASGNYITCGNLQCGQPDYAEAITAYKDKAVEEVLDSSLKPLLDARKVLTDDIASTSRDYRHAEKIIAEDNRQIEKIDALINRLKGGVK